MGFDIIKSDLDKLEQRDKVYLEDVLRVIKYFNNDLKNLGYENGITRMEIKEEDDFVSELINVFRMLSNTYHRNKLVFEVENRQKRLDNATRKSDELTVQLGILEQEIEKVNQLVKEQANIENTIQDELKKKKELDILLKEKKQSVDTLNIKLREIKSTEKEINDYKQNLIPNAEDSLSEKKSACIKEKDAYEEICKQIDERKKVLEEIIKKKRIELIGIQKKEEEHRKEENAVALEVASLEKSIQDLQLKKKSSQNQKKLFEEGMKQIQVDITVLESEIAANRVLKTELENSIRSKRKEAKEIEGETIELNSLLAIESGKNKDLEEAKELLKKNLEDERTKTEEYEFSKDRNRELESKISELEKNIAELENKSTDFEHTLKEKQKQYSREFEEKEKQYGEESRKIDELRSKFILQKKMTRNMVKNYEIQNKKYGEYQEWLSNRFKELFEDIELAENLGFEANAYVRELKDKFEIQRKEIDEKLKTERELFEKILRKIESE